MISDEEWATYKAVYGKIAEVAKVFAPDWYPGDGASPTQNGIDLFWVVDGNESSYGSPQYRTESFLITWDMFKDSEVERVERVKKERKLNEMRLELSQLKSRRNQAMSDVERTKDLVEKARDQALVNYNRNLDYLDGINTQMKTLRQQIEELEK